MAKREVKTPGAALARTNNPIAAIDTGRPRSRSKGRDGLMNVISGLGTSQDKRTHSYWARPRVLTRDELENMYRGSWLAKRIINSVADDMTSKGWRFGFDAESEDAKADIRKFEKKFGVYAKVNEALRWARLYGGGVLLLGVNGQGDLSQPLDPSLVKPGQLRWVRPMDRWRLGAAGPIITDLESPFFGDPETYIVAESSVQVHRSRLMKFDGEKLPYFPWTANGYWHDSSLQHVLDSIMNYDTTTQGIASMIFEANVDVISGVGLAELLSQEDGEAKVAKRFQAAAMMKSFTKMLLLDAEETYEKKSNTFNGLPQVVQQFANDISGAADIPITRLFGQSPGGLSSTGEGDLQNYYTMVSSKQDADLRDPLERFYEIAGRSEGFFEDKMELFFEPLWTMSEATQADVDLKVAQRDQIYLGAAVVTEEVVAKDLKEKGTYRNLTDDDIEAIVEMNAPIDPADDLGNGLDLGQRPPAPNPPAPGDKPIDPKKAPAPGSPEALAAAQKAAEEEAENA